MKKTIAVFLAFLLLTCYSTVAFASYFFLEVKIRPYVYAWSNNKYVQETDIGSTPVASGVTYYIPVSQRATVENNGYEPLNAILISDHTLPLTLDASKSQGLITEVEWVIAQSSYGDTSNYIAVTAAPNLTNQIVEASFTITITANQDYNIALIDVDENSADYSYTIFLLPAEESATSDTHTTPPLPVHLSPVFEPMVLCEMV